MLKNTMGERLSICADNWVPGYALELIIQLSMKDRRCACFGPWPTSAEEGCAPFPKSLDLAAGQESDHAGLLVAASVKDTAKFYNFNIFHKI